MDNQQFISVEEFCRYFSIEVSLINTLRDFNLIHLVTMDGVVYIGADQLATTEKMIRLHTELAINAEGLDAIRHLLQKIADMQLEITLLKNKLRLYES